MIIQLTSPFNAPETASLSENRSVFYCTKCDSVFHNIIREYVVCPCSHKIRRDEIQVDGYLKKMMEVARLAFRYFEYNLMDSEAMEISKRITELRKEIKLD